MISRAAIAPPPPLLLLLLLLLLTTPWGPIAGEPILFTGGSFKGLPELPNVDPSTGATRAVYYHEQIVAVVDVAKGQRLAHCELVEVYEASEVNEILRNLSTNFQPHKVSFKDIIKLMDNCDKLDENPARALPLASTSTENSKIGNPLLLGIIPGTKWCGTGDIAKNYHDLGTRTRVDRCCRAHDLCPVKIRAYKSRYNLTNYSFFTKSHCTCDETFYKCLKGINHVAANIIGNIYFNIAQPPCIGDEPTSSDKITKRFVYMLNISILRYFIEGI